MRQSEERSDKLARPYLIITLFAIRFAHHRGRIAYLPDIYLSRFLTDKLLIPTLSSLVLLIFLALDPIRCYSSGLGREYCIRTLTAQGGLGMIFLIGMTFEVCNSIFPTQLLKKNEITLRKIGEGGRAGVKRQHIYITYQKYSARRYAPPTNRLPLVATLVALIAALGGFSPLLFLKACCLSFSVLCIFFLFSQYNTRAQMSEAEFLFMVVTGGTGGVVLIMVGMCEWFHRLGHQKNTTDDFFPSGRRMGTATPTMAHLSSSSTSCSAPLASLHPSETSSSPSCNASL